MKKQKFIYIKRTVGILAVAATYLLTSCGDDIHYDIVGDPVNRVFVNTQTNNVNNYVFTVTHTPASIIGDEVTVQFPVRSTLPATADIQVTFSVDNGLVNEYNEAHNTNYREISTEAVTLENNILTIASGHTSSSDSLSISVGNRSIFTVGESYLLPLRITNVSGTGGEEISNNLSTVYILVNTDWTNVYTTPQTSIPEAILVTNANSDWSGWSAMATPVPTGGNISNMFTTTTSGNANNNAWTVSPATQLDIEIDMGDIFQSISGFSWVTANNFRPMSTEVYVSRDAQEWTFQGTVPLSAANTQFIRFFDKVEGKHLRFRILTWQNNQGIRIFRFNLWQ